MKFDIDKTLNNYVIFKEVEIEDEVLESGVFIPLSAKEKDRHEDVAIGIVVAPGSGELLTNQYFMYEKPGSMALNFRDRLDGKPLKAIKPNYIIAKLDLVEA